MCDVIADCSLNSRMDVALQLFSVKSTADEASEVVWKPTPATIHSDGGSFTRWFPDVQKYVRSAERIE